jgi:hypothetical protein
MTTFPALDTAPGVEPDLPVALRDEWEFLARPGTWLTGEERVAVAAVARAARSGREAAATPSSHP